MQSATPELPQGKASGRAKLAIISSTFQLAASQIGPNPAETRRPAPPPGDVQRVKPRTKRCRTTTIASAEGCGTPISASERFHTAAARLVAAPANSDAHIHAQNCAIQDRVPSVNSTQLNHVTAGRPKKVSGVDQAKKFCATLFAVKLFPVDNIHARRSATQAIAAIAK